MTTKNLKTKAIILGSKNLGEKDKYIFMYTKDHGKIKAVAKGAMNITSKFTGPTQTLNICDVEIYKGPQKNIITEIKILKNYKELLENFRRASSALLIAKITNDMTFENIPQPQIYDLTEETIRHISKNKKNILTSCAFVIKLLDIQGFIPNFKENHSYHTKFSIKYTKLLNYIKTKSLDEIEKIAMTKEEEQILKNIIKEVIETETSKPFTLPL